MLLLKWLWLGHDGEVTPKIVFYTLRILMFFVSFVLEDWAIHELVPNKLQQRQAIMLLASSYVTWTYQTHTFSNSIVTIVVAWSLVLINRIVGDKVWSLRASIAGQLLTSCSVAHHHLPLQFWLCLQFSAPSTESHFQPS